MTDFLSTHMKLSNIQLEAKKIYASGQLFLLYFVAVADAF